MSYKLLVFDWDGTLMDSQQEIVSCFQWASRDLGYSIPSVEQVRNIIGLGMQEAVESIFPELDAPELRQEFVDRYRHHYFSPQKPPSELFEGVFDMLVSLQEKDYFLAVATGKGRRGLNGALERTNLKDVFHFTRCVDEAHSKPHPQMLEDAMDYLGATEDETLMIGDTEYDLQMAMNAKVDSVAVSCGAHEKDRLLNLSPKVCLDYSIQLEDWLAKKN